MEAPARDRRRRPGRTEAKWPQLLEDVDLLIARTDLARAIGRARRRIDGHGKAAGQSIGDPGCIQCRDNRATLGMEVKRHGAEYTLTAPGPHSLMRYSLKVCPRLTQ